MEFRNIYADNAFIFMSDFEQAVKDGFRVQDTIAGYPRLQGMLKECKMFRGPEVLSTKPSNETRGKVTIVEYCPVKFLLQAQSLILAGYEVWLDAPVYGISFGSPHRCMFIRTEKSDVVAAEEMMKEVNQETKSSEASDDVVEEKKPRGRRGRK